LLRYDVVITTDSAMMDRRSPICIHRLGSPSRFSLAALNKTARVNYEASRKRAAAPAVTLAPELKK